jgi:hypothetical protein
MVNLWGSVREREHFAELVRQDPNMDKADVGEMVLAHDWPVVMQQQHVEWQAVRFKTLDAWQILI